MDTTAFRLTPGGRPRADVQPLIDAVDRIAPDAIDAWETTAVIESLGFSDRRIRREFGFRDARALARHISHQVRPRPAQPPLRVSRGWRGTVRDAGAFVVRFCSCFIYSLPWTVMILLESRWPDALQVPADLAGLLSLALMASLITTGGFIQAIVRRGQFYICLNEPELAGRVSMLLVKMAFKVIVVCAGAAVLLAVYLGAFPSRYVAIAIVHYALLCVLWIICALLAVERRWLALVATISTAAGVYPLLRIAGHGGPVTAQLAATCAAAAVACVGARQILFAPLRRAARREMDLPRRSLLLHSLAPYFAYGFGYFTFLFADRLCAGASVPLAWGLFFGMEAGYKRVMDAALLTFLICAALVECLNHCFMEAWYAEAKSRHSMEAAALSARLRTRYIVFCGIVAASAAILGYVAATALVDQQVLLLHRGLWAAGVLGYLLLSVALLNAVILFSVRRPMAVVDALWPALFVNFTVGYVLSRAFAPDLAIAGLVVGSSVFALLSTRGALSALRTADYTYFSA
jgi:hypothetical protein